MKKFFLLLGLFCNIQAHAFSSTVPDEFGIKQEGQWKQLGQEIISTPDKEITLFWQGYGGYVDIGQDFIQAMETAQAQGKHITFVLSNGSYSMHADVACYADTLIFSPGAFLMFHPAAAGAADTPMTGLVDVKNMFVLVKPCLDSGVVTSEDVTKFATYWELYVYKCTDGVSYCKSWKPDRRQV